MRNTSFQFASALFYTLRPAGETADGSPIQHEEYVGFFKPTLPPYAPLEWVKLPLAERGRQVCEAWAIEGYGGPVAVYGLYGLKILAYIGGWIFFCRFTPGLGELATIGDWWLSDVAFQKAILWSMLFEGLGLGCGSGPLTGRYFPPLGGFLYFLRPGTTKLALFPGLPVIGGVRRTWLDVVVYLALVLSLVRALVAAEIDLALLLPIVVLVGVVGILDRTLFLVLRSEHYWTTTVCFAAGGNWIAGAKAVQLALWFWAGVSKLNRHFPSVVCVMTSNSPFTQSASFRKRMYRDYPRDLRPSTLARGMAHAGAALELAVPTVLVLSQGGWSLVLGMVLMLLLHGFITSNVPMGVPLEWNVAVVYGAFALFWAHPDVSIFDVDSTPLAVFLVFMLLVVPLVGNLAPRWVSFLLAMRYYAGNWPFGVWLFRGESYRKLDRLTKTAPWIYDQLDRFFDHATAVGLVGKVLGFRLMHLHGRALPYLLPKAVERLEDYEYLDGELVAGLVLGWNFGDGHLHNERFLQAVQQQCGFDEGELRCVFVESQPMGRGTLAYRIHDAKTGLMEVGEVDVRSLEARQPWEAP